MNRTHFIRQLKDFNENYYRITENDSSYDEFENRLSEEEKKHFFPLYHKLDISKISQITLSKNNCFEEFYNLDDEMLFYFFEVLTNTDKALEIFDRQVNTVKDAQKTKNRNNALISKVNDISYYAEATETRFLDSTINDLEMMKQSLQNNHFSKRNLFESLLFHMVIILDRKKNTQKTSDVTNSIIKNYFDIDDISFTKDTDIKQFTSRTYNYGYLKNLILHHR